MKKPQKTVNIRLWKKTRDRLKIRAVKSGVTMMKLLDQLSLVK